MMETEDRFDVQLVVPPVVRVLFEGDNQVMLETLDMIAAGYTQEEIADIRGVSSKSVRRQLSGNADEAVCDGSLSEKGVYGLAEQISGERPEKRDTVGALLKIGALVLMQRRKDYG